MADEITPQQPNLVEQYAQSVNQRKLEAEAQMQKLIDSLNVRKYMPFDPVLMGYARGVLSPTKTGSFGESLGYGLGAASEEAQKQAVQQVERAKMEFELRQKQEAQRAAQEEQKFAIEFFNRQGMQPPAAAIPQLTGAPPVEALPLSSKPQMSTPEAPAVLPEEMPIPSGAPVGALTGAGAPTGGMRMSDRDRALLAVVSPNVAKIQSEAEERARKLEDLELKRRQTEAQERVTIESGGVKVSVPKIDADRMSSAIEKRDYKTAQRLYEKYALPFPFVKEGENYRLKTAAEAAEEIEAAKAIETKPYFIPEVGGKVAMLPRDFKAYREAVKEGKGEEWVDKNLRRKPVSGEPTKAEAKPFLTEEELAAEQKRRERKAEEQAKSEVKTRDNYISNAEVATLIEKPANQILKIASDRIKGKALGLLENPDVFSAVAGAAAEGVRAGPINIGIPAIRDAVAKVSGDPKEREQILDALQMLGRNYSEIELLFTRRYLEKQGQVTEGERAIVRQVSGGVGNRRTVALAQTETLLQRAAFDKAVKTEFLQWEKANPNKSIDEFTESAGYKKLHSDLDRNMNAIYDKYFGDKKESRAEPKAAESKPASAAPAGSLRERIDAAKKARGL